MVIVATLGNPLGYESSVTQGIIRTTQRRMGNQPGDFIQTSSTIFPGNSGGSLVDIHGRVIGINTQVKVAKETVLDI